MLGAAFKAHDPDEAAGPAASPIAAEALLRHAFISAAHPDNLSSIKYDMDKAVTGKSKDPYDQYTFAEIAKKGGICSDQAYFSANTARAHGIPASILSGDGPRGPHAWIHPPPWLPSAIG